MFICKKCKNDKKCWCSLQSRGFCEMCGEDSVCVDHHCDIDMPNKQKEDEQWEKEFDERFDECENDGCNMFVSTRQYKEVKQFIKEKLEQKDRQIRALKQCLQDNHNFSGIGQAREDEGGGEYLFCVVEGCGARMIKS